jgi:hypothetical protein
LRRRLRLLRLVMRRDDDPVHVRVTHEGAEPVGDSVEGEPLEDGAVRETDRARPVGPITKSGLSRTLGGATRCRRCGCVEAFGEDRRHLSFCRQYPTGIGSPGTT